MAPPPLPPDREPVFRALGPSVAGVRKTTLRAAGDTQNVGWGAVRLLDADPDFAAAAPDADPLGPRTLVVPDLRLPEGPWAPPGALSRAVAIVVLDGVLVGTGVTFGRPDVRLLGPGDMLDGATLTHSDTAWRVLCPAHIAILERGFVLAARRWPTLIVALARRLSQAQQEQHVRAAITAMPRVEERILALLCHLAQRWGHVTHDGITLTLPITHELLGSLIGSRRPTVSLALRSLTADGLLRRRDGLWILPAQSGAWPESGVPHGPFGELGTDADDPERSARRAWTPGTAEGAI